MTGSQNVAKWILFIVLSIPEAVRWVGTLGGRVCLFKTMLSSWQLLEVRFGVPAHQQSPAKLTGKNCKPAIGRNT